MNISPRGTFRSYFTRVDSSEKNPHPLIELQCESFGLFLLTAKKFLAEMEENK